MSQENQITLRGYVTAEPKLRQTATKTPVTDIRVGCTPRRLNRGTGEWEDAPSSYYRVTAWRRLAVNIASSVHKGDLVIVRGKFYMNTWVDNEQRLRSALEIEADSVGHDLAYGWSHFLRGVKDRPADQAAAGELARQETELPEGPGDPEEPGEYPGDSDWAEAADALVTDGETGFAEPEAVAVAAVG
jgi:single-strand DNA-binding protein